MTSVRTKNQSTNFKTLNKKNKKIVTAFKK